MICLFTLLQLMQHIHQTKPQVLSKGQGHAQPQRGDICTITYTGTLDDGTVVEQRTAAVVQIGDVEVVQGLDMAIPLMLIGERAQLTCDARFAYGSIGLPADEATGTKAIPPLARIVYIVELLDCSDEQDIAEQPFEKRRDAGVSKRERGNFWYARGDFNMAIQLYRRSLEYLNDNGPGVDVNAENDVCIQIVCFVNKIHSTHMYFASR